MIETAWNLLSNCCLLLSWDLPWSIALSIQDVVWYVWLCQPSRRNCFWFRLRLLMSFLYPLLSIWWKSQWLCAWHPGWRGWNFPVMGIRRPKQKNREDKQVATCSFQGRSFEQRLQYPMYPSVHFFKLPLIHRGIPEPKNQAIFFGGRMVHEP